MTVCNALPEACADHVADWVKHRRSTLSVQTLRDMARTIEWFSNQPQGTDVFDGPGHVQQFSNAYKSGGTQRRLSMCTLASALYSTSTGSDRWFEACNWLEDTLAKLSAAATLNA